MELGSQLSPSASSLRPQKDPWSLYPESPRIRRYSTVTLGTSRPTSPWRLTSPATSGRDLRIRRAQRPKQVRWAPLSPLFRARRLCSREAGATDSQPMLRSTLAARAAQDLSLVAERQCSHISRGPGVPCSREGAQGQKGLR